MKTIIVPILPGKTEAWRRLLQELSGSRRECFAEWCTHWNIQDLMISLAEKASMPFVIISFQENGAGDVNWQLVQKETVFMRWLRKQTIALHGIDLNALLAGPAPTPLLKFRPGPREVHKPY